MKRKVAFTALLLLCLSTGAAACFLVFQSGIEQPAAAAVAAPTKQSTLSAPTGFMQEEKKEAVLPALPALPETAAPQESSSEQAASTYEPRYSYMASHSSQRLFIREAPSLRAKIIGSLQPGESGEVIRIEEAWVLLKYQDIEGYVFKEYLTLTELPRS